MLEGATGINVKAQDVVGRKVLRASKTFTVPTNKGANSAKWWRDIVATVDTGYRIGAWGSSANTFIAEVSKDAGQAGSFSSGSPSNAKWGYSAAVIEMTTWNGPHTVWCDITLHTYYAYTQGTQELTVRLYEII